MLREVGIVVAVVSGDFGTEPARKSNTLVGGTEFDLAYNEAFVSPMELIDFPSVDAVGVTDKMPGFLYYRRLCKIKQMAGIFDRYLHFPLKTAESAVEGCTFYSDKTRIITYTHTNGAL